MLHTKYKFGQYNNFLCTGYIKQGPLNRDKLLKKKEYPYKIPRKKRKMCTGHKNNFKYMLLQYSTVICASVGRARGGGWGGGRWDDWIIWSQGLLCCV
jgi:hypothetical protein